MNGREVFGTRESILADEEEPLLKERQLRALRYFLENQTESGLFLDRQANHGPLRPRGLCSVSTTGLGFVSLALASADPHRLIDREHAVERICTGLRTSLENLPHEQGVLPHFVESDSLAVVGDDVRSTIDTGLLVAGGLWASEFLQDARLRELASALYERIHWRYWSREQRGYLLGHGRAANGELCCSCWDRLNGETAFLYLLAAGASEDRALPRESWSALKPFYETTEGLKFRSADLGLFVHLLALMDFQDWEAPGAENIVEHAAMAVQANILACKNRAQQYSTFQSFWGRSAGDGPGADSLSYQYGEYDILRIFDGTVNLMIAMAVGVRHNLSAVMENILEAERDGNILGRYGDSNVNRDHQWVAPDAVGIDAGAIVLSLDNRSMGRRVARVFERIPCVQRGMARLGFKRRGPQVTPQTAA